ncbi:hypothetical protein BC829DRAFT_486566 [Chytridium lagenaria]|nr:hypothetical protein BC829DRAFT_486566 [Chytridium lagenaria]
MMSASADDVDLQRGGDYKARPSKINTRRLSRGNQQRSSFDGNMEESYNSNRKLNQRNDDSSHINRNFREHSADDFQRRRYDDDNSREFGKDYGRDSGRQNQNNQNRRGRGGKQQNRGGGGRKFGDFSKNTPRKDNITPPRRDNDIPRRTASNPVRRDTDISPSSPRKDSEFVAKEESLKPVLEDKDFKPPLTLEEIKKLKMQKQGSVEAESVDSNREALLLDENDELPPPPPPPLPPMLQAGESEPTQDGIALLFKDDMQENDDEARKEDTNTNNSADKPPPPSEHQSNRDEVSLPIRRFDIQDDEVAYSDSEIDAGDKGDRTSTASIARKEDAMKNDSERMRDQRGPPEHSRQLNDASAKLNDSSDCRKSYENNGNHQRQKDQRDKHAMDWSNIVERGTSVLWLEKLSVELDIKSDNSPKQSRFKPGGRFGEDARLKVIDGAEGTPSKMARPSDTPARDSRRGRSPPRRRRSLDVSDRSNSRANNLGMDVDDKDSRAFDDGRRYGVNNQRRQASTSPSRFRGNNRDDRQDPSWSVNQRRKREVEDLEGDREAKRIREENRASRSYRPVARIEPKPVADNKEIYELLDSEAQLVKALAKLQDAAKIDVASCVDVSRSVLNAASRAKKLYVAEEAFKILQEALTMRNGTRPTLDDLMGLITVYVSNGMTDKMNTLLLGLKP